MNPISSDQVLNIALDELMPDPSQPRKIFLDEEIQRLAASIAARGILQPLRVFRDEQRQVWVILTGESRYRAAKLARLTSVPCLPVAGELSEVEKLADRLIENDCRRDLEAMESARALARLKALMGCNSKTLVEKFGFSNSYITKSESLLSLPPDIQELIGSGPGQIAAATAYEISRLPDEASMRELAQAVITKHLPRDAVADAVRGKVGKRRIAPKAGRLACKHAGISITVSSGEPLTRAGLMVALDHLKKQAQKLPDQPAKGVPAPTQQTA